ncbi:hypothetical protein OV090_07495 [Nannocystis sp. RBIL2]|nr:hypothetical protein [Nannocystis sp. RBIL2]MCY1064599.1 hypothetical protein [Nannocystis sp. RBIL2]
MTTWPKSRVLELAPARIFKEWGLGGAMVVITGFLFVYHVLGYIAA